MTRRLTVNTDDPTYIAASSEGASYEKGSEVTYNSESENDEEKQQNPPQRLFVQVKPPSPTSSSSGFYIPDRSESYYSDYSGKDVKKHEESKKESEKKSSTKSSESSEESLKSPNYVPEKLEQKQKSSNSESSDNKSEQKSEKSNTNTKQENESYEYVEDDSNSDESSNENENQSVSETPATPQEIPTENSNHSSKKSSSSSSSSSSEVQEEEEEEEKHEEIKPKEEEEKKEEIKPREEEEKREIVQQKEEEEEKKEETQQKQEEEEKHEEIEVECIEEEEIKEEHLSSSSSSHSSHSSHRSEPEFIQREIKIQSDSEHSKSSKKEEEKEKKKTNKFDLYSIIMQQKRLEEKSESEEYPEENNNAKGKELKPRKLRHRFMYESDSADEDNDPKKKKRQKKSKYLNDSDDDSLFLPRVRDQIDIYDLMRRGGRHIDKDQFDSSSDSVEGEDSLTSLKTKKSKKSKSSSRSTSESESKSSSFARKHKQNKFLDNDDDFNDKYSMPLTKTQEFREKLKAAQENRPAVVITDEDVKFFDEEEEEEEQKEITPEQQAQNERQMRNMKLPPQQAEAKTPVKGKKGAAPPQEVQKENTSESYSYSTWIVQPQSPFLHGDESSRADDPFASMDGKTYRNIPQKKLKHPKDADVISSDFFYKVQGTKLNRDPTRNDPYYQRTQMGRLVEEDVYYGRKQPEEVVEREVVVEDTKKPKRKLKARKPKDPNVGDLEIASQESTSAIRRRKNKFLAMESDSEYDSDEVRRRKRYEAMRMKYSPFLDDNDPNRHGKRFMPNYEDDPDEKPRIYTYRGKNTRTIQRIVDY